MVRLALFISALALLVAVGANITSTKLAINRSDDNRQRIAEVRHLVHQIQLQRARVTLESCIDTNRRNMHTKLVLHRILVKAEKADPSRSAQLNASERSTDVIIDALAPIRNCEAQVKNRFGFVPRDP